MDANLKAKWIEALRSGDYKQTIGTLRKCDGFCCLGVLCDVSGAGEWQTAPIDGGVQEYRIGKVRSRMYLEPILRAQLGLTDDEAVYPLIDMNDDGTTFPEIADYIEANL